MKYKLVVKNVVIDTFNSFDAAVKAAAATRTDLYSYYIADYFNGIEIRSEMAMGAGA